MNKNIQLAVGIIILFLGVAVAPLSQGTVIEVSNYPILYGNTLYVGGGGPGNYTKIQDAIDDAKRGDTVFVYDDSSPYFEVIWIDKRIKLIGEKRETTIIDGTGHYYESTIRSYTKSITICGFTITGGDWAGIDLSGLPGDKKIINNVIR